MEWSDFEKYTMEKLDKIEGKLDDFGTRIALTEFKIYVGAFIVTVVTTAIVNKFFV